MKDSKTKIILTGIMMLIFLIQNIISEANTRKPQIRVAVGAMRGIRIPGIEPEDNGSYIMNIIQGYLVGTNRFTVLADLEDIKLIDKEQDLNLRAVRDREQLEVSAIPSDIIIGTILISVGNNRVQLIIKLLKVYTDEIIRHESGKTKSSLDEIENLLTQLTEEIVFNNFPIECTINLVRGPDVVINQGANQGVKEGMAFVVSTESREAIEHRELGAILVTAVSSNSSVARIVTNPVLRSIHSGDRIREIKKEVKHPSLKLIAVRSAITPGWGQYYNNQQLKGTIIQLLDTSAVAALVTLDALRRDTWKYYKEALQYGCWDDAISIRERATDFRTGEIIVGVFAGVIRLYAMYDALHNVGNQPNFQIRRDNAGLILIVTFGNNW